MRALNLFFILLFVFSAVVQYNDPDPYVWMPIYLYGALICFMAFRKMFNVWLYIPALAVYLGYAGYLFFAPDGVLDWINVHNAENITATMKAEMPWIEAAREFFGLLLLVLALGANMLWLMRERIRAVQLTSKQV